MGVEIDYENKVVTVSGSTTYTASELYEHVKKSLETEMLNLDIKVMYIDGVKVMVDGKPILAKIP